MKRRNTFLLQGTRQLNLGAIVSGAGFLLYILAAVLGWTAAADLLALAFGLVSAYVLVSVAVERRRDKNAVTYNLLWGQAALALLNGMCAVLALWDKAGR